MKLWSISFSYRLGLGFHALNNEGADGSNLMQPRRIDVGNITYDGISGEIIRHHILEHFINACRAGSIPVLPLSEGLHPDRGPIGIRAAAKELEYAELTNDKLYASVRKAIEKCAVLDVGGYLAAWKEQDGGGQKKEYIAEKSYLDSNCAKYKDAEPVKRESCFDVAWLISEAPQDLTVTQHSAFRNTTEMNSRYAQTMRSNIYAGVIRADLHRIGTDDYWYLQDKTERLAVTPEEQKKRQVALIQAIANFIASPTGAKVAGWAPHVFLTEGAILLTSSRTAPFRSPIKVSLGDSENPIQSDPSYAKAMEGLANERDGTWVWIFTDTKGLIDAVAKATNVLKG
jgi:CRISPR-associated autoregulator DevR family